MVPSDPTPKELAGEDAHVYVTTPTLDVFGTRHDAVGHAAILSRRDVLVEHEVVPISAGDLPVVGAAEREMQTLAGFPKSV